MNQIKTILYFGFLFAIAACSSEEVSDQEEGGEIGEVEHVETIEVSDHEVFIRVLGTVQDGGAPHAGCEKECCADLFANPDSTKKVVCLGLVDRINEKSWMFEATPDLTTQMKVLKWATGFQQEEAPDGIFLTHAHIGHYVGLMFLGHEALGASNVPVYAMPRMEEFLKTNGPWSQLVEYENIAIKPITDGNAVELTNSVSVTPFLVPHRDEYSETVGFHMQGPNKSAIFIPDVNKWAVWDKNIIEEIAKVDYAFVDATFYGQGELKNRDMSEMPHPFIVESMELFKDLDSTEKSKVHFIHLNHSNPVLQTGSEAYKNVIDSGFNVAQYGDEFGL